MIATPDAFVPNSIGVRNAMTWLAACFLTAAASSGEQRRTAQTLDARRYVTGQEINSVPKGALGFVLNVIVLWNTIHTYMDEARSHQTTANCAVPASRASRASRSLMTTCRTSRPFVTSTFASKDDIDSMFRRH